MPTRLEETLQRDIERIRVKIGQMAHLCERALSDCLTALRERDRQLAYSIILRDTRIDEMEEEVDRLCLEFLVRQQPVAGPLRFAYSTIRINLELERVGDYAESIARQSLKLIPMEIAIPLDRFEEMASLSIPMLRESVKAFVDQDCDLARKNIETEAAVDLLKSKLNKDVIDLFRENKIPFEALNPLMMITRRLERVSDQAKNICVEVLYMCTGEYVRHQGTEAYRILFVDESNSSRSQIAEAIANGLNQAKFIFTSAGLTPETIPAGTIEFLQSKGLDPSTLHPKPVSHVPNLEHYHVVVTLAPEARKAFPPRPRKSVFIDWSLEDPLKVQGTPAEKRAAYEKTYQFLSEHIKDLVTAILGNETV